MNKIFTKEENIQILLTLLKEHNIHKVIINPGTTNINFAASVQSDDFFEVYSCVDERSAAYMACGMAEESGEPVVLTCTGATASRNYLPALTEAYYNKLPIIAVTATQHLGRVGQNIPQIIDRSSPLNDVVKISVQIPSVYSDEDKWACNLNINKALLETKRNGGGPVHINLVTSYDNEFTTNIPQAQRAIKRVEYGDIFPNIIDKYKKIILLIGNHKKMTEQLTKSIEKFCEKYNAVVLCDHTSNYYGKYKILGSLCCNQVVKSDNLAADLVIDIGNISGAYMNFSTNDVWRVNPDGEIRDTYKKLKYVFQMKEEVFFNYYNEISTNYNTSFYETWYREDSKLRNKIESIDLPFSNLWIAKNIIGKMKENSKIHLAILNTLRCWDYFLSKEKLNIYCNTGGFGIDGIMSTALGASIATNEPVYCFIGDLAFFYDMNSIGNKNLKNNLHIMLINNGCGTEFHNYNHRAVKISKENNLSIEYFAADGHYGNKSEKLVKHYAEDLGFKYICAKNKEEFIQNINVFINENNSSPILFEVFTSSNDESKAIEIINNINSDTKAKIKTILKNSINEKTKNRIKKIIGR